MPYLFDTSAISEVFRPRPDLSYVSWLASVPREAQFTAMMVIGELYAGAYKPGVSGTWLRRIEQDVLPTFTVLPFDYEAARTYGRLRAELNAAGRPVGDADLMIAAVAVRFGLEVVTANIRHFEPVPGLTVRAVHR